MVTVRKRYGNSQGSENRIGHSIITTAQTGHKNYYQPMKRVRKSTWSITGNVVQHKIENP